MPRALVSASFEGNEMNSTSALVFFRLESLRRLAGCSALLLDVFRSELVGLTYRSVLLTEHTEFLRSTYRSVLLTEHTELVR